MLITSKLSGGAGEYLATEKRVNKRWQDVKERVAENYNANIQIIFTSPKKKVKILQLYPNINFARTRESTRTHVTYRRHSASWVIKMLRYKEVNQTK